MMRCTWVIPPPLAPPCSIPAVIAPASADGLLVAAGHGATGAELDGGRDSGSGDQLSDDGAQSRDGGHSGHWTQLTMSYSSASSGAVGRLLAGDR
jgi:hypothetical protein